MTKLLIQKKNPSDGCSHSALTASTCIWSHPRGAFFTLLEHYGVISYKVNKVHTLVHTLFSACNCSVPSQLRVKMHSKSPSVMAFCLVCLGILAKNMPKRLAGYYLLNSYSILLCSLLNASLLSFHAFGVPPMIEQPS